MNREMSVGSLYIPNSVWYLIIIWSIPISIYLSCAAFAIQYRNGTIGILLKILIALIAIYSALISTYVLCIYAPRQISEDDLGFDYIGVIIGILALLVTLLIGWNIYSVLDTKDKITEIDKKSIQNTAN